MTKQKAPSARSITAIIAACEDAARELRYAFANVDYPSNVFAEIHRDDCRRLAKRLEAAVDRIKGAKA